MDEADRESADRIRSLLSQGLSTPSVFHAALTSVPSLDRDAWVDSVFGLDAIPDDDPALPRGCVPYLPCSANTLLRAVDAAKVQPSDVFVDVGSGVGRAALLVQLLTGASAIGIEIQPGLVQASRDLATRLKVSRFSAMEGEAVHLAGTIATGSVFFLYCPFGRDRLEKVLDDLAPSAREREIRICAVDLPLPPRPWLSVGAPSAGDLVVYRSIPGGIEKTRSAESSESPSGQVRDLPGGFG